jgi:hypothetical protein
MAARCRFDHGSSRHTDHLHVSGADAGLDVTEPVKVGRRAAPLRAISRSEPGGASIFLQGSMPGDG